MDTHNKIKVEELKVDEALFSFINTEVLPPLSFDQTKFWKSFNKLVYKLTPTPTPIPVLLTHTCLALR